MEAGMLLLFYLGAALLFIVISSVTHLVISFALSATPPAPPTRHQQPVPQVPPVSPRSHAPQHPATPLAPNRSAVFGQPPAPGGLPAAHAAQTSDRAIQTGSTKLAWTEPQILFPNILLGVAALFVCAAGIIFATVTGSTVLRVIALWLVATLLYAAGLGICRFTQRLRPVGFTLTAMGMALIPTAGGFLGALPQVPASVAWLAASVAGVVSYGLALWFIRAEVIAWFGVLFIASLVLSIMNFLPLPPIGFFCTLIATATVFVVIAGLGRRTLPRRITRPNLILGEVLAPTALGSAVFIYPFPPAWQWSLLCVFLTIFYVAAGFSDGWRWRAACARVAAVLSIIFAAMASASALGGQRHDQIAAMGLACCTVALWHLTETLVANRKRFMAGRIGLARTVTGVSIGAAVLAIPLSLSLDSDKGWVPACMGVLFFIIGALALSVTVRDDSPVHRGLGIATVLFGLMWLIFAINRWTQLNEQQLSTVLMLCVLLVLALDLAVAGWCNLPRNRRLVRLRRGSAIFTTSSAVILGTQVSFIAQTAGWFGAAGLIFTLIGLSVGAFWSRNALVTLGIVPVIFGLSVHRPDFAPGDPYLLADALTKPLRTVLLAALFAVLLLVSALLRSQGRTWRARYADIALYVLVPALLLGTKSVAFAFSHETWIVAMYWWLDAAIACAILAAVESHRRILQRQRPYSRTYAPAVVAYSVAAIIGAAVWMNPTGPWWLLVPAGLLGVAVTITAALRSQLPWIMLLATVSMLVLAELPLRGLSEFGTANLALAGWVAWAMWYGLYWTLRALHRGHMPAFVGAVISILWAAAWTAGTNLTVPGFASFPQFLAGVTIIAIAAMLIGVMHGLAHKTARNVTTQIVLYVCALGASIATDGVVSIRFFVVVHFFALAAIVSAWLAHRRGGSRSAITVRVFIAFGILTVVGAVTALAAGSWYTVMFLADHVALLIFGALTYRSTAVWWGLVAIVAGMMWFLRDLVWLALIVLALILVGVVIWLLMRKPSAPTAGLVAPSPPAATPSLATPPNLAPPSPREHFRPPMHSAPQQAGTGRPEIWQPGVRQAGIRQPGQVPYPGSSGYPGNPQPGDSTPNPDTRPGKNHNGPPVPPYPGY